MTLIGLNYLHTQELRMPQMISLFIWVHSTRSQVVSCTGCSKRVFPSYPFFPFLFFLPPTPWRALSCVPCPFPSDPCLISHVSLAILTTLYWSWGQQWSSPKVQEGQVPLTDLDLRLCSLFATLETSNVAPFCLYLGCPFLCILLCFPGYSFFILYFTCTWTGVVKSNGTSDSTPSVLSQKQPFHTASVVFLKVFVHKWVPCVILRNTKCITLYIWVYELLFSP